MKVIIAGGRTYDNAKDFYTHMKELEKLQLANFFISEIVCGGAKGADRLGAKWGEYFNIPVKLFPADWEQYGKSAGYIRNSEMGGYADSLIAFWDGSSKGTKHMIDIMKKLGKPYRIISI